MAKIQQQPAQQPRKSGRPSVGSFRLETMLPVECLRELMRREAASGEYRTRIAARILIIELVGTKHLPPN